VDKSGTENENENENENESESENDNDNDNKNRRASNPKIMGSRGLVFMDFLA
jgi:hypothetical protein